MQQIVATSGPTNIGLLSVGAYRPERVVTNDELCQNIDSSDEWIYSGPESRPADSPPATNPPVRWRSRQAKKRSPRRHSRRPTSTA